MATVVRRECPQLYSCIERYEIELENRDVMERFISNITESADNQPHSIIAQAHSAIYTLISS